MSNRGHSSTGGGGAGYDAIVYLEPGTYTISVGEGGIGRGSYMNNNSPGGDDGYATTLSKDGVVCISAGGGTAGKSNQWGADYVGKGGTITVKNIKEYKVTLKKNGGPGGESGYNATTIGTPGPFENATFGRSGNAEGRASGGAAWSSCNGYASVNFVGYLPPNEDNSNNRIFGLLYKDIQYYIKV